MQIDIGKTWNRILFPLILLFTWQETGDFDSIEEIADFKNQNKTVENQFKIQNQDLQNAMQVPEHLGLGQTSIVITEESRDFNKSQELARRRKVWKFDVEKNQTDPNSQWFHRCLWTLIQRLDFQCQSSIVNWHDHGEEATKELI